MLYSKRKLFIDGCFYLAPPVLLAVLNALSRNEEQNEQALLHADALSKISIQLKTGYHVVVRFLLRAKKIEITQIVELYFYYKLLTKHYLVAIIEL